LDTVDEDQTVLCGDELEVDGMHNWPNLPGTLASTEEVILDLGSNGVEGVSVDQSKVRKENSHEDWADEGRHRRTEAKVRSFVSRISGACSAEKGDSNLPPDGLINGDL
jgi:hypothetical protein